MLFVVLCKLVNSHSMEWEMNRTKTKPLLLSNHRGHGIIDPTAMKKISSGKGFMDGRGLNTHF